MFVDNVAVGPSARLTPEEFNDFLAWVDTKPKDEKYEFWNITSCPAAQYLTLKFGDTDLGRPGRMHLWDALHWDHRTNLAMSYTFGGLANSMKKYQQVRAQ